ncbi:hypothetical protein [Allobranchiibius sp. CTAmp26]|uniref:hypothetical protein n=1 Tax=Allobranchiibius sp. CTAmp26 TaxID=2815214 RepID=UPI001AA11D55|nr:hypothetical protein [Allobranchiibius sp. CTAmp26]MBO1756451.1 hypothetical protein [Allobranchiibius sp. CTAmp26]
MIDHGWLPIELHPVAMRLARADAAAEELAKVALSWSRGDNDLGAVTLRQVERTSGTYDVEIARIRPVPPLASMLFSEAVHHLRASLDNAVFYMAEQEHGRPFTPGQARAVSMPIYDTQEGFDAKIRRLSTGKHAIPAFGASGALGQRLAALQPFNDRTTIGSLSKFLALMMGVSAAQAQPLKLLRDYSNEDKHRTMRAAAGHTLVQRLDVSRQTVSKGMRPIDVGTVIEQVPMDVPTGVEISPALLFERPDGDWVAPGPELDGIGRHVADIVIPSLVSGTARTHAVPAHIDLSDNGETMPARLAGGGTARAHERARETMTEAFRLATQQGWHVLSVVEEP